MLKGFDSIYQFDILIHVIFFLILVFLISMIEPLLVAVSLAHFIPLI